MESNCDNEVIVIGAGPAGLLACFWLQKLNIPHALLEKESFPRPKSCADILTSKAIRRLNEVDPQFIPEMVATGMMKPINGTYLSAVDDARLKLKYKWLDDKEGVFSSCSIDRADLDNYLLNKVKTSSLTTVLTGVQVTSVERAEEYCTIHLKGRVPITSKMVIVSTGSNFNPFTQHKNYNIDDKHLALGIRAYYKGVEVDDNDFCHFYTDDHIMPGGFYVAPLQNGLYNVNMVIRKDIVKARKLDLKKEFEDFIITNEQVKDSFKNATRVSSYMGSSLALGTKKRSICGDRYLLAGDAAGLIDLISANGIPQAMLSGKLAALQVEKSLSRNNYSKNFLKQYETALFKAIKGDLSVGRVLNPLLSYKLVNNTVLKAVRIFSRSASKNSNLAELLYAKRPALLLFNPLFYLRLFTKKST